MANGLRAEMGWFQGASTQLIVVCSAGKRRHRPVILRDTAPEDPNHDHGQQSEEGLEQSAVDLPICRLAEVGADHIVKDLPNGE